MATVAATLASQVSEVIYVGMNNDESKEIDLKQLFEKIQMDESILDVIRGQNIILFIGRTGAGKTTTICFIAGDKMVFKMRKFYASDGTELLETILEAEVPVPFFDVGHTADSTTKSVHTRPLPGSESILTDSCGFLDTEGVTVDVANAISLRNAMRLCSSLRPVILIDARIIGADKGGPFESLLDLIIRFFTPIRDFLPSMTFLFTHGEPSLRSDKIQKELGRLSNSAHVKKDPAKLAIVEYLFQYVKRYSNRCILLSEDLVSDDGAPQKRDDVLDLIQQPAALTQDLISHLDCPISDEAQNILKLKCDEIHVSIIHLLEQCEYRQVLDHLNTLQLLESSVQLDFMTEVWETCLNLIVSHLDGLVQSIDQNYEEGNYEKLGVNMNHCRVSLCLEPFKDLSEDYYRRVIVLNEHVANLSNLILNCPNLNQNAEEIADTLKRLKLIQRHLRFVLIEDSRQPRGYDFVVSHLESRYATINTRCESFLSLLDRMILSPVRSEKEIVSENAELILLLSEHRIDIPPTDSQSEDHHTQLSFSISVLFDDLNELKAAAGDDLQGHLSSVTIGYFASRVDQLLAILQAAHTNLMGDAGDGALCEIQALSLTPERSRELFRTHDLLQVCYSCGANDFVGCSLYDFPSCFVEEVIDLCTATLNRLDTCLLHFDYAAMETPLRVLTSLEFNDSNFLSSFKSGMLLPKIKTVKDHLKKLSETCSTNLNTIRTTNSVETSEYLSTAKSLSSLRSSCCLDFLYSVQSGDDSSPSCYCSELSTLASQDWTKRVSNFLSIIATEDFSILKQFFSQLEIMTHLRSAILDDLLMSEDIQRIVSSIERVVNDIDQVGQSLTDQGRLNDTKYLGPLIRCEIYLRFLSECCRSSLLFSKFFASETWSNKLQDKLRDWRSDTLLVIQESLCEARDNCMEALERKDGNELKKNLDILRDLCCFDDFIDPTCTANYSATQPILKNKLENLFRTAKEFLRRRSLDNVQATQAFLESYPLYETHFDGIDFRSHLMDLCDGFVKVVDNIPEEVEKLLKSNKFKRIKPKMLMIQNSSPEMFDECDELMTEYFEDLMESIREYQSVKKVDADTIDKFSRNLKVIQDAQVLSEVISFDLGRLFSFACSTVANLFSKLRKRFIFCMELYNFSGASQVLEQLVQFDVFDASLLTTKVNATSSTYSDLVENLLRDYVENLKPTLEEACKSVLKDSVPTQTPGANADNDFMNVDFDLNKLRLLFQSVSSQKFFEDRIDFSSIPGSLSVLVSNHLISQSSRIQHFLNANDLDMAYISLNICRNILGCCESYLPIHSVNNLQSALKNHEDNLLALRSDVRVPMIFQAKYMEQIQRHFELLKKEGFVPYRDAYVEFLAVFAEKSTKVNAVVDRDLSTIDRSTLGALINFSEALSSFKVKIVQNNDHTTRDSCDTLMRRLEGFFFQFCFYWKGAISECSDLTTPHTLMSLLIRSKPQISPIFEKVDHVVEFFRLVESVQKAIEEVNERLQFSYQEVEKYDLFASRNTDSLKAQLEFLRKQSVLEPPQAYTLPHTLPHLPTMPSSNREGHFTKALKVLRSSILTATERLKTYLQKEDFATAALGMTNLSTLGQFSDLSEDCKNVENQFQEEINRLIEDVVRSVRESFHRDDDDNGKELARLVLVASSIDIAFRYCMKEKKLAMDEVNSLFGNEMSRLVSFSTSGAAISLEEHSHNILAITSLVSEISNYSVQSLAKESIDRYLNRLKDSKLNLSRLSDILCDAGPSGAKVISDHSQFQGAQVRKFNEETAAIHIDHALAELKQLNDLSDTQVNRLKEVHASYSQSYESFLNRYLAGYSRESTQRVQSLDELVVEIECIASDLQDRMVDLLAGVFALWTIMRSSELFEGSNEKIYLIRPHAVQLIAIFRLLGLDQENSLFSSLMQLVTGRSSRKLSGHLIQVGTGEGKSILLAGLSCVLSLLGYEVCCASYSQHLSKRDDEMFRPLFERLNISSKIKYSTLGGLVEQVIQGGELRSQIHDVVVPPSNSSKKSKKSPKKSRKQIPRILLIDEVDVFFSPDFFGVTYNPASMISSPEIEAIFRYIWNTRHNLHSPLLPEIKNLPEYSHLVSRCIPEASQLIDHHIKKMLGDVNDFAQCRYEVVEMEDGTWKIGYKSLDSVDCDLVDGYRTAFAYLHESSKRPEISLRDVLSMSVRCGSFSYAEIPCSDGDSPFQSIMGVTGTLDSLIDVEKRIVKDKYGLVNYTFTPSMYGKSKLLHKPVGDVIMETEVNRYHQTILKEIIDEREKGRPVLVYFDSEEKLNEFLDSSYGSQLNDVNIVTEKTHNIPFYVERATRAQMVTLLPRSFGRGLDFKCLDVAVDTAGGVHVIQTFFSDFLSEEIQIKGRTARQSKKGSYKLILLASDLEKKLKLTTEELTQSFQTDKFYDTLHEKRVQLLTASVSSQITQAEGLKELHQRSYQFMRDLRSGEFSSAELLNKIMSFD